MPSRLATSAEPRYTCTVVGTSESDAARAARTVRHAARDAAIGALARDAAHDLKGVLNIITMNVELLSRSAQDPAAHSMSPEQAQRSADVLRRKLQRLDRTVDLLLGLRPEDDGPPEMVNVTDLVERVVEFASGRARRQRVEMSLAAAGPVTATAHPDGLQAALLALLVNALDAMPDGGRLDITVSDGQGAAIEIADSGPGIAGDQVDAIWRPHVTTRPHRAGVGLPAARAIVEEQGGRLSHQPNPGGGSCFVIELPQSVSR
jgi:two-component system, NtrC family, sensor histidine kinase HydH